MHCASAPATFLPSAMAPARVGTSLPALCMLLLPVDVHQSNSSATPRVTRWAFLVNAHDSPRALRIQLRNFRAFVRGELKVIVHPGHALANQLEATRPLPDELVINPLELRKRRFHGSMLEGIVGGARHMVQGMKL